MLNSGKIALGLASFLGIAAAACSSPASTIPVGTTQQPTTDSGGEVDQVNRIAYVSPNGDLFTVDPDGEALPNSPARSRPRAGPKVVSNPNR